MNLVNLHDFKSDIGIDLPFGWYHQETKGISEGAQCFQSSNVNTSGVPFATTKYGDCGVTSEVNTVAAFLNWLLWAIFVGVIELLIYRTNKRFR